MVEKKIRAVHFLNQFFGQEGGEDKADIGFMVKAGPVGPGILLDRLLGDNVTIVNTLICGDNYFSTNVADAVEEAVGRISEMQPDLFFAGPAFHAGRYGVACGALVKAVKERLSTPSVTGMFPENPGVDLGRKFGYIVETGVSTMHMQDALTGMAALGLKLLNNEPIGSAAAEGYIPRGFVKNESLENSGAIRAIDMLLCKVKGEPFESELPLPEIEEIPPAPKVPDMAKAKIALVSDGGLVPRGNPDRLKMSQNTIFAAYDIDEFIKNPFQIAHSGYHHSQIRENVNRLLPLDVIMEMKEEGVYKELLPVFYSTSGNTTTIESSRNVGRGIAERLKESGVDAVILTST